MNKTLEYIFVGVVLLGSGASHLLPSKWAVRVAAVTAGLALSFIILRVKGLI